MRQVPLSVALVVVVQGGFAAALALGARPAAGEPGVDLATYLLAARALREGSDIYALSPSDWEELARQAGIVAFAPPYRYPPLIAALAAPLTAVPFAAAFALWSLFSVAALVLAAAVLARVSAGRWSDRPTFVMTAAWVPALTTIYAGQSNHFVLAATAGAMLAPLTARAAALGVGLALKPLAAPIIALALWRREARVAAAAVVAALALALLAGVDPFLSYVQHAAALSTLSPDQDLSHPSNISLFGVATRALPAAPELARALAVIAGVGLIASLVPTVRRAPWPLAVGMVAVATVLVEPVGWYQHATLALLAVPSLWHLSDRRGRIALVAAVAMLDVYGVTWRSLGEASAFLPLATAALLVLHVLGLLASRRARGGS